MDSNEIDKRTEELIELVGLDSTYLNRYPNELSGGQQQELELRGPCLRP